MSVDAGSGLSSPEGALSGPYNTEHYNTQGKVIKEGRAQLQGLLDEAIMGPLSILLQVWFWDKNTFDYPGWFALGIRQWQMSLLVLPEVYRNVRNVPISPARISEVYNTIENGSFRRNWQGWERDTALQSHYSFLAGASPMLVEGDSYSLSCP